MSWRADLLANRKAFTRGAADPVVTRAKFTLAENPALIQAVQNAQSPQEAHTLMADAWKLVRYNKHGGENAARLATTHARANSFAGGQMLPGMPAPCGTSMGSTAQADTFGLNSTVGQGTAVLGQPSPTPDLAPFPGQPLTAAAESTGFSSDPVATQ